MATAIKQTIFITKKDPDIGICQTNVGAECDLMLSVVVAFPLDALGQITPEFCSF